MVNQALVFQITANSMCNGVREPRELNSIRRLYPLKPHRASLGAPGVHTVQKQHVKMYVRFKWGQSKNSLTVLQKMQMV